MSSDQQVTAKAVLDAELDLRRRGPKAILEELEQVEPDLMNYLLETLSDLHGMLLALGGRARATQKVFLEIQHLTLICITALRRGHFELWRQSDAAAGLEADREPPERSPDSPPPSAS